MIALIDYGAGNLTSVRKALAALHERSVDEAAFLWVAHDVGPRAMTPKIKGFVQPKSWFVDFSTMTIN